MSEPALTEHDALLGWLETSERRIAEFADPAHHTYLDLYLGRADAMHVLEHPPERVVMELVKGARCYAAHGELYLRRWPHSRVRQRRLAPLELALIVREPAVMEAIGDMMGAPTLALLADMSSDALSAEVRAVTGGTLGDVPAGPGGAVGALALLYWARLSALIAGDGAGFDAAGVQARIVQSAVEVERQGAAARMMAAHDALDALKPLDAGAFFTAWGEHVRVATSESPQGLDRAGLALGCAGALAGLDLTSGASPGCLERYVAYVRVAMAQGGSE